MTRPAILAVDGGGSKIDVALVGKDGRLLGAARWSGSTYDQSDRVGALEEMAAAVKAACADAGVDPDRLSFTGTLRVLRRAVSAFQRGITQPDLAPLLSSGC